MYHTCINTLPEQPEKPIQCNTTCVPCENRGSARIVPPVQYSVTPVHPARTAGAGTGLPPQQVQLRELAYPLRGRVRRRTRADISARYCFLILLRYRVFMKNCVFHNSLQPLPRLHRFKRPSKLSTKCKCVQSFLLAGNFLYNQ